MGEGATKVGCPSQGEHWTTGPGMAMGGVLSPQSVTCSGHLPSRHCAVRPVAAGQCGAIGPGAEAASPRLLPADGGAAGREGEGEDDW